MFSDFKLDYKAAVINKGLARETDTKINGNK